MLNRSGDRFVSRQRSSLLDGDWLGAVLWSDRGPDRNADRNPDRNPDRSLPTRHTLDEKAKTAYVHAAFADAIAIYLLSLTLDFDYMDLREREYPLLAASALAERLRAVAALFPPNPGYEFQILYRRR